MNCWFGKIELANQVQQNEINSLYKEGVMILNEFGIIAHTEWCKLPDRYKNVQLEIFQIMPNHLHGILILNESTTNDQNEREIDRHAPVIGEIIGSYKSIVSNRCLELFKTK